MTGSKAGRKQIIKVMGEDGAQLVKLFTDIVEMHSDTATAEKMEKYIFKIAAKMRVFSDEGKVTDAQFKPIRMPAKGFLKSLADGQWELDAARAQLGEVHTGLIAVMEPLVTGDSIPRLNFIFEYLRDSDLLDKLLSDAEYAAAKDALATTLSDVIDFEELSELGDNEQEIKSVRVEANLDAKMASVVDTIKTYWKKVGQTETEIGEPMMAAFLEENPELRPLFENTDSQDFSWCWLYGINSLQRLVSRLQEYTYGLKLAHEREVPEATYDKMLEFFCNYQKEKFGRAFGKRVKFSFTTLFNILAEPFKQHGV
ncbi:MAG: hypothetical protein MHM6MM_000992 [Cercozoa sp. M6MM]